MAPARASDKRWVPQKASSQAALPLFLPCAAAAGTRAIVISPTRLLDSRHEQRNRTLDRAVEEALSVPLPWPVLGAERNPATYGVRARGVDAKAENSLKKKAPKLKHDQIHDRVSAVRRVYTQPARVSAAFVVQSNAQRSRERVMPPVLDPLDCFELGVMRQQQATLAAAVSSRMDRASRIVPIQFLRDHEQHHAFAERVVLLAMARLLQRHYTRVQRAAWIEWTKHTLTRRILDDHARKHFILRQSSLAHACAIVQRHVTARTRAWWSRWVLTTELLRRRARTDSARRIQRCWRAWLLHRKLQWWLAVGSQQRVSDASAAVIQSSVRRFLARCAMAHVVWLHCRHVAAGTIQQTCHHDVMRQIAVRTRQSLAAGAIQRVWRALQGRRRAHARQVSCQVAVQQFMAAQRWQHQAIETVATQHRSAGRIQHCFRVFVYRQRAARGLERARHRRWMVPVGRLQTTWRKYRRALLRQVIDAIVCRVGMTHACAVRRIQRCFRRHWQRTLDAASRRIAKLLGAFHARRVMVRGRVVPWLVAWRGQCLQQWMRACAGDASTWRQPLRNWRDRVDAFAAAHCVARQRLDVVKGLRLVLQCKAFGWSFEVARAIEIQRAWRWYRLRVLVGERQQAATVLQRALGRQFQQYKQRLQRQRVLQQWKRQRFVELRSHLDQWKREHLRSMHARDLSTSTRKLRKARWFHHHKLRKRMLQQWRNYVLCRRAKHHTLDSAKAFDRVTTLRRSWHVWRHDALPRWCCANRLHEIKTTLALWETWTRFVKRKQASKRARHHRQRTLKASALAAWQRDRVESLDRVRRADSVCFKHTSMHVFRWFARYVANMKRVRAFCRAKQRVYALRHWLVRVYDTKTRRDRTRQALMLRRRLLQRATWQQWRKYVAHRARQRCTLQQAAQYYTERRLRCVATTWSRELVPMGKDSRLIASVAAMYRGRKLKELYFCQGLARFWAATAGARRIAMAIRIQRAYRGTRARRKVFVLRLTIQYQLETRFATAVDVQQWTAPLLRAAVETYEWVFVLFSFPWAPVDARVRKAFSKTATTWTYLRNQASRVAFGAVDATQCMEDPAHAFSLMSWLGLQPTQLPCVVGFWRGVGPPVRSATEPTSRLVNGETHALKRRFQAVCTASSLIYQWPIPSPPRQGPPHDHALPGPVTMPQLVAWIERLQFAAVEATAVDLQSFIRGFLARRHTKRRRVLTKQRQIQRIRAWIGTRIATWESKRREAAASTIQRWIRQVFVRRARWESFQHAMRVAKQALHRLQRFVRLGLARKRLRRALTSLLATCDRYVNAPLCQACFHVTSTLARLRCRDCQQAYCADCFGQTHKSGKRLLHLCDRIDFVDMNSDECKLCTQCEVRRVRRYCHTCAADQRALPGGAWTCVECFQVKHTDRSGHSKQTHVWWWHCHSFQTHEWVRLGYALDDTSGAPLTASMVMGKYAWQSKRTALGKLQAAARVDESIRERDDKLLAIRLQHEAILREAFDRFDTDQSGALDRLELKRMFQEELCEPWSDAQVDEAIQRMDTSGNGRIEFDELMAWFANETLEKAAQRRDEPRSLVLLKEALQAKRQMRRFKEKLHEFVPSVSLAGLADQPKRVLAEAMAQWTERRETHTQRPQTVPGFPRVEWLAHSDFARKRKVLYRFLHEICGLDWIYEDDAVIPVANAMQVFDHVFVPRWNAGELTHDFYFDGECFEFNGERWQRRWEAATKRYVFTTTRCKSTVRVETGMTTRPSASRSWRRNGRKQQQSSATSDAHEPTTEMAATSVEIVELIDPRRKQMLLDDAQTAFRHADVDGSGSVDADKFHRMLTRELCEPVTKAKAQQMLQQLDANGSGQIDFDAFFQWYAVTKCQEFPLTPPMERARALLQTKKRVYERVASAVHVSVASGRVLMETMERLRKERQLVKDCKGASTELRALLHEGHEKKLAEKALALHSQDVAFARHWLEAKRCGERDAQEQAARATAQRQAHAKKAMRVKQQRRRHKIQATRLYLKNLLVGRSKKEAHVARVQQALMNLDRDILLVEQRLATQD